MKQLKRFFKSLKKTRQPSLSQHNKLMMHGSHLKMQTLNCQTIQQLKNLETSMACKMKPPLKAAVTKALKNKPSGMDGKVKENAEKKKNSTKK